MELALARLHMLRSTLYVIAIIIIIASVRFPLP